MPHFRVWFSSCFSLKYDFDKEHVHLFLLLFWHWPGTFRPLQVVDCANGSQSRETGCYIIILHIFPIYTAAVITCAKFEIVSEEREVWSFVVSPIQYHRNCERVSVWRDLNFKSTYLSCLMQKSTGQYFPGEYFLHRFFRTISKSPLFCSLCIQLLHIG